MLATAQAAQPAHSPQPKHPNQESDLQDPRKLINSMIENLVSQQDQQDIEQIKLQQFATKQLREKSIKQVKEEIESIIEKERELSRSLENTELQQILNLLQSEKQTLLSTMERMDAQSKALKDQITNLENEIGSLKHEESRDLPLTKQVLILSIFQKLGIEFFDMMPNGQFKRGICRSLSTLNVSSFEINDRFSQFYWGNRSN